MSYKTELHCHTREVSKCGKASAEATVEKYLSLGYSTVVLTNHFSRFTFDNHRYGNLTDLSWEMKVRFFVSGYERMREVAGDRLNILLGCELRPNKHDCDFLIYGVTEEFLLSVPGLIDMKLADISAAVRSAGLIFGQPHPFRDGTKIAKPELLDAMEVFNGNLGHGNRNEIARLWAEKFDLIPTAGGDNHAASDSCSGIITEAPITTNEELLSVLRSREYELIRYGDLPY